MDTSTYDQIHMSAEALGDSKGYLVNDALIRVEFYGDEPVGIELPQTVDLLVKETVPGHQGRDGQRPGEAGDARDRPGRVKCRPSSTKATGFASTRKPANTSRAPERDRDPSS